MTTATEETIVSQVINWTVKMVVQGLLAAEDTIEEGKRIVREGRKDRARFLAQAPMLYEAVLAGETPAGLLALAGYQSTNKEAENYRNDQQLRYDIKTGEVMSRLTADKTKPETVSKAVNRIADKNYAGFTKHECDALIDRLVDEGKTWADFVSAVEEYGKDAEVVKDDKAVTRVVQRVHLLTAGQRAQLILALQETK
jgi:hypothetical protein